MQIVIDVPEDVYTRLFDNGIQDNEIAVDDICEMARSLRLGKPLPKGHGRLIDESNLSLMTVHLIDGVLVCDTPSIIEADKAESEEV